MTEYKTTGQRLSFLRRLSGKTRAQISRAHGIPEISLRQLEHDKYRLTEKTAQRCYEIYAQEGIHVTLEWIKTGSGLDPLFATRLNQSLSCLSVQEEPSPFPSPESDELLQVQEAYAFQKKHPHATILFITGDEMGPFYAPGDYVGGIFYDMSRPELRKLCVGKDCIIELEPQVQVFRRLIQANETPLFNLVALNPTTQGLEPVLYHRSVLRAAPVIWHRRPTLAMA